MIKLLLLIPDLGIGGAQKQFLETANQLKKDKNLEICVVSINNVNSFSGFDHLEIKFLRNSKGLFSLFFSFIKYIRIVHNFRPNIVHSWLGRSHKFSTFGKFIFSYKNILSFRNTVVADFKTNKVISFYFFSRFLVDLYICNSKKQVSCLPVIFDINSSKVKFVPNGFHFSEKFGNHSNIKKPFSGKIINILLPSRICEQKNQLGILNFFLQYPDLFNYFKLKFVGPVYDLDYFENLVYVINLNSLNSEKVEIISNSKDISNEFIDSDIVVLNSVFEGFSNVILETWFYKRLLIVNSNSDPNEVVINEFNGYKYSSYSELSKLLYWLIDVKESGFEEILVNGDSTLNNYRFSFVADQFLQFYLYSLKR
jgi:glycosyltransferase involved in cell wall biosynthesis